MASVALVLTPQLGRDACGASWPRREPRPPAPAEEGEEGTGGSAPGRAAEVARAAGHAPWKAARARLETLPRMRRPRRATSPGPHSVGSASPARPAGRRARVSISFLAKSVPSRGGHGEGNSYSYIGFGFEKRVFSYFCRRHLPVWPSPPPPTRPPGNFHFLPKLVRKEDCGPLLTCSRLHPLPPTPEFVRSKSFRFLVLCHANKFCQSRARMGPCRQF